MGTKRLDEEAIFHAARQIEKAEERATFIEQACGRDKAFAQRVQALLEMYAADSEIHDAAASQTLDCAPITERPGSMIGSYKLKEQIGEGGFGVVFVAEQQEPVKRKVALKVIKPGMDTREVIARFTAERQALALMDHPNIARVLDAGATDSGRPYFVMELVRGIAITDYCDQNQLSPRVRLDLFMTVCHAIQHAHQKGIIHRDIKPSNVLVTSHDGKPVVKVIDFGVAKAINQQLTERSIYTNFAQMIGTPLYMSPEQAEMSGLDIDTRSDIYSLGVLLYELLTGTTPLEKKRFAKAAYDEIRRMIREDEPPKPSNRLSTSDSIASIAAQRHTEPAKLSKLMRGDLDWITMKALEKDRTRRYETANGLARDIQRYMSDEAVEACPPSATYRLRKFAHKNRAALTTAAAIALLLVAGVAASTWQAIRATRSEQVAMAAREAEAEQRQLAERNEQKALSAAAAEKAAKETAEAREADTKAVLEFVKDKIFAAARPEGQEGGLGREVTLRKAIDAALPFVELSFANQPLIEAQLRMTLGQSFGYLGEAALSEAQLEKARSLYTIHCGPDHPDTLQSMASLANTYADLGRLAEAFKLREETQALRNAMLGPNHPDTLASSVNLAHSLGALRRATEAVEIYERILPVMKATMPDHPSTFNCMDGLAVGYRALGRHDESLKLTEETFALRKAKLGPDHPLTLNSMNSVAVSYRKAGKLDLALPLFEETLKLKKAKLGPDHPDTLNTMNSLAVAYQAAGKLDLALPLFEETLKLTVAKFGPDHPHTLTCIGYLAVGYDADKQFDKAELLHRERLQLEIQKSGGDSPAAAGALALLGLNLLKQQKWTDAEPLLRECLAIREKTQPDVWSTFNTKSMLGGVLLGQQKYADAEPLLLAGYDGLKQREKTIPAESPVRLPEAIERLVQLYEAIDKNDEAATWRAELEKAKQ